MAAATQPRNSPRRPTGKQPVCGYVQKAGTVILKGCAAMHVAGVFQPAASAVSGAVFAGFAEDTYDASAEGSNFTWARPMVFHRDARALDGKGGDLPTAALLGTLVPLDDDQTVKATSATNDVKVRLLEIEPAPSGTGSRFWVEPE